MNAALRPDPGPGPVTPPTLEARREAARLYTGRFDPGRQAPVLPDEAAALRAARALAAEIAPAAADREGEIIPPVAELERASDLGLASLFVPLSHGGPEASYGTLARVVTEVAVANPSVAQILIAQYTLGDVITDKGTPAQRDRYLPLILRGARIGNAMTEAKTRSAADVTTRLSPDGPGRWRLDGEKFYATGSFTSHYFPVTAEDDRGALVFAFVARDAEGVEVLDDWRGVGQRASVSGTARFRGVLVDDLAVVRPAGPPGAHSGNTFAQLLHAATDVGIARGALEAGAEFLRGSARPWPEAEVSRASEEAHVVRTFGELKVLEMAADALVERAAATLDRLRRDQGNAPLQSEAIVAVAAARAAADHAALTASSEIFALGGARTGLESWNLDRFWRNARTHTVHDPIRWRHHAIGNFHLNGVAPADNARAARRKPVAPA